MRFDINTEVNINKLISLLPPINGPRIYLLIVKACCLSDMTNAGDALSTATSERSAPTKERGQRNGAASARTAPTIPQNAGAKALEGPPVKEQEVKEPTEEKEPKE